MWKLSLSERLKNKNYVDWIKECENVAGRFGLAPWTVEMACLLKGYDPEEHPFPIGAQWPSIRITTRHTDALFLKHLFYHALSFGIHVYVQRGSWETAVIFFDYEPPTSPLPESSRPPRDEAFSVDLKLPPNYPPEAAQQMSKDAAQLSRELLRRLGYRAPRRLRTTALLPQLHKLRLNEYPLPNNAIYDIIDDTFGEGGPLTDDQRRRSLVKSRRNKLRRHLTRPYQTGD